MNNCKQDFEVASIELIYTSVNVRDCTIFRS